MDKNRKGKYMMYNPATKQKTEVFSAVVEDLIENGYIEETYLNLILNKRST